MEKFVKFEYDLQYTGGNYHLTGNFVFVPVELVEKHGEKAFELHTGYDICHIINF